MSNDFERYEDFNLDGIDRDAASYLKPLRPSQRREARKLTKLIERVLTANPDMSTAAVRGILQRHQRMGTLPDTATFNREFASICRETLDRLKNSKGTRQPASTTKRRVTSVAPAVPVMRNTANASGTVAPSFPSNRLPDPANAAKPHPLAIYDGKFGGMVFKQGGVLRTFFSAIEKKRDDATLKSLAAAVAADADALAHLAQLHPKDRSIFEAALALP